MATKNTIKWLTAFFQLAPSPMFLSNFFILKPEGIHESEYVEIDIERDGEDIAPVLIDGCTGYNVNDASVFTSKEFKPPVLAEELQIDACSLLPREPGENPYQSEGFMRKAMQKVQRGLNKLFPKFRRTIELQASTILQTGICSLMGKDGSVQYMLDYQAKPSHFPTVLATWAAGAGTPLEDIQALCEVIRMDGKRVVTDLIFGRVAWADINKNSEWKANLDIRRMELGEVRPQQMPEDANYMGTVWIGEYPLRLWTYTGYFKHPSTGVLTRYVDDSNVIFLSEGARLDATFGGSPIFTPPNSVAANFVPRRLASLGSQMNALVNAWISPNGEILSVGVKVRPLLVPVEIDSFGCLITRP